MKPISLKTQHRRVPWFGVLLMVLLMGSGPARATGPMPVMVILAPIDGVDLTPDNILGYQVQSNLPSATNALIKGTVRYKGNSLTFNYSFNYTIRPGLNRIDAAIAHPVWSFSSTPLRELFMDYKKLPQGTYEYCVEITPVAANGEAIAGGEYEECLYQKSEDIFLINLIEPENNAKIYGYNPVLSWVVNYPFASALTYRIRVAEITEGQNTQGAIVRNNPVYQESNLVQTSQIYPVYGKPLEAYQPYAWTVDAYYKGLLLGGAEPWRFTIVVDSEMTSLPRASLFVDIRKEKDASAYYAVGVIKLKYVLDEKPKEILRIQLVDKNGNKIAIKEKELKAQLGDNRYEIDLKEQVSLKHLGLYELIISNSSGEEFKLPVKYVNPDFFK